MKWVLIKTKFRDGSNDSLGIIVGSSEYVKESVDRKIKIGEKCMISLEN